VLTVRHVRSMNGPDRTGSRLLLMPSLVERGDASSFATSLVALTLHLLPRLQAVRGEPPCREDDRVRRSARTCARMSAGRDKPNEHQDAAAVERQTARVERLAKKSWSRRSARFERRTSEGSPGAGQRERLPFLIAAL
jgi:hypothetical protein